MYNCQLTEALGTYSF